jgi:hypothetical protein
MIQQSLDDEQVNRIHQIRITWVSVFYQRLNFFLVFESVLLGTVGLLYSRPLIPLLIVRVISVLGLAITLLWWPIQADIGYKYRIADIYTREISSEYRELRARMKKELVPYWALKLLSHAMPALVLLLWIMLLIFL